MGGAWIIVTNAYRQVHLLYRRTRNDRGGVTTVTNAYRQVHLLYEVIPYTNYYKFRSQMPIGKYIYCTLDKELGGSPKFNWSQMPIGKYIYCTPLTEILEKSNLLSHKCLSASTFTVPGTIMNTDNIIVVTNAYRQVHLLYLREI